MPKYVDNTGAVHEVDFTAEELLGGAKASGMTPVQYVNNKFPDADLAIGTAFKQIQASIGICSPGEDNPFGLRPTRMADLLGSDYQAAGAVSNTTSATGTFGTASRALAVISIIDRIENQLSRDRQTDIDTFYSMVGTSLTINTEHFEQPVINYGTPGGPEQAKASRVSQGANPPKMLSFSTSDRIRRIGAWNIGMEYTDQALAATTLDFVSMTVARYFQIERDERAYRYISSLWNGDGDLNVGAVPGVTSVSLDPLSTGGVLTHRAWVKFLARSRKFRRITYAIMDIDTYLKVEGRVGRPGSNNYDPTLARIDPQAIAMNVGFGNDVKVFIVESAAEGGPVAANEILALDASAAITKVTNTAAVYSGVESYAMKRTTAMRMDWSEEVFRTFGDSELRLFDRLTIS